MLCDSSIHHFSAINHLFDFTRSCMMWLARALVWVSAVGGCFSSYLPSVCVYCVCVYMQLPADFSRLHLADGLHPQVTHVSSSHSGCSITSDSGSSSLSDIYQVRMPPWRCGSPVWTPLDSSREVIKTFLDAWLHMNVSWAGSKFEISVVSIISSFWDFPHGRSCNNFGEATKRLFIKKDWLYYF